MTRDELIRMAVQCQLVHAGNREGLYMDALAEFSALVAAAEREACAKVLDEMADQMVADMEPSTAINWVRNRAAAIRARGQA